MSSYLYVSIEQGTRHSLHYPGSPMPSISSHSCTDTLQRNSPPPTLATCCEILIACFASLITSAYTLHHEKRIIAAGIGHGAPESQILAFNPGRFSFFLDPSPALMLASCLILGCAISSFAYRRQEQDRYQNPIFILAITAASIFGLVMGVSANLIMLGLIPWTLCFSMVFSCTSHWLVRRCSPRPRYIFYEIDEKEALLHH